MLKIRLSRRGKKSQPSYSVVIQEHTSPIKGKFVEEVGVYMPASPEKTFKINEERVKHWLSVGAQPSDSVAGQLKKLGFTDMEKYMEPRNKKRKPKKEQPEAPAAAAPAPAPAQEEAPATEEEAAA